jgi:type III restriction enzyme
MLNLKTYQKRAVEELETYLKLVRTFPSNGHKNAFISEKNKEYHELGLDNVPFVCIKIPTGGGKTIVASHMLNSIYEQFAQSKNLKGLALWLVPTTAIKTQTINALKDRNHPYREILDKKFSNEIIIMDVKGAQSIKKSDIENNLCIIVSTVSAFRIKDKEGRKVFSENGSLLEHFEAISKEVEKNLEKDENDETIVSLMNVIKMSTPIIIADEGHHVKAPLSIEMFQRMNPSIVVEFTATPILAESNVLVDVGVGELKDENMIKMPIILSTSAQWQKTIDEGVSKRDELEKIADKEKGEYIRPISLIQAEQVKEDAKKIHVNKIAKYLTDEHKIPPNQIAINTGDMNIVLDGGKNMTELGDDIFEKDCEIRYIITKDKLKEGWDNRFAYVLITVANLSAKISVEQIIGRIMRLPNAKQKKNEELNRAFVYTSSTNFEEAAKSLRAGLIQNGYTEEEAANAIVTSSQSSNPSQFKKINEDKDIKIPFFGIKDKKRKLEFNEDLVMNSFDLTKQKIPEIIILNEQDATAKIDVKDNELKISKQMTLNLVYGNKFFAKDDLLAWLDRHVLKKIQYSQAEKRKYFESVIDEYIKKKDNNLAELSIGCYRLKEQIENHINELEESTAKIEFEQMSKSKKIDLNEVFLDLPDKIIINNTCSDEFDKHLYEKAGILNSEELKLARKIDGLDNILWWYRSPEKKPEAIFLQGWNKNKFYPDFIIKTKNGNYILTEYKGEHLVTNDDTKYKKELGKKWEEMTPSNYTFELVDKHGIDEFIIKIEKL